ncbi:MAG TPA: transposase [Casimicrobiaceae bacterium]|nr:transposase [Casimicrobiaceae bacterium]
MHQTRKGKQWYFGMKVHTGTNVDSGLVHTVIATSANVADVNVLGELLHGAEESLHGDCAYHAKALEEQAQAASIAYNVNQRGSKHRPLSKRQRARNRCLSRTRATVEHAFLPSGFGAIPRCAIAGSRRTGTDVCAVRSGEPVPCCDTA